MARWLASAGLVALASLAQPALAQESGGSFGGGDFGGGGGGGDYGGGGGGDYGGGGGGESAGGGDYGSFGGASSGGGTFTGSVVGDFVVALAGIVIIGLVSARLGSKKGKRRKRSQRGSGVFLHVASLQLGIDWRARKDVQETLARLAASGRAGSAEGRAELLRETVAVLRRAELSWLYVGSAQQEGNSGPDAESRFRGMADDARARFRREVVRDRAGEVSHGDAPIVVARPEEGDGVVVVTVVVATRRRLRVADAAGGAAAIRATLEELRRRPGDQLAAIEVVWSPAVETDRMSTAELEQHYPELRKIDPASIAGRVFCAYCRAPFAMELGACPHCGAAVSRQPPPDRT